MHKKIDFIISYLYKGLEIYFKGVIDLIFRIEEGLGSITFNKAIKNFNNFLYKENKAESTALAYTKDLDLFKYFLVYKLNNKIRYLSQITLIEIESYKYFLSDKVNNGEFKMTTASRKFNALKTFFAYLEKEFNIKNIIYGDKWGNRERSRDWKEEGEDFAPDVLELEDIDLLLDTIKNSTDKNKFRDLAIFETLVGIGCRRSELLNMKWHHINFYKSEVKIIRQKAKNVNVLKIPIEMKNALEHYRNTLTSAGEYVFKSRQSDTLSTSAFNSAIKKWIVKSGLNKSKHFDITAHTFRGTFITMCIRAGIEDSKILEYTGHKDRNTLEIYKKLVAKDLEDVANVRDILRQKNNNDFLTRRVV